MFFAIYPYSYNNLDLLSSASQVIGTNAIPVLDTLDGKIEIVSVYDINKLLKEYKIYNISRSKEGVLYVSINWSSFKYYGKIGTTPISAFAGGSTLFNYRVRADRMEFGFAKSGRDVEIVCKDSGVTLAGKYHLFNNYSGYGVKFLYAFRDDDFIFCRFKYGRHITASNDYEAYMAFGKATLSGVSFTIVFDLYGNLLACCCTGANSNENYRNGKYVGTGAEKNMWSTRFNEFKFTGFDNMPDCALHSKLNLLGGGTFAY